MVEVDAIQQNSAQIFHKIHFPNDSDDVRHTHTLSLKVLDEVSIVVHTLSLSVFSLWQLIITGIISLGFTFLCVLTAVLS